MGADILSGSTTGADTFIYGNAAESGTGAGTSDTITNFNAITGASHDTLDIIGLHGSFNFIGASAFTATGNSQANFNHDTKILSVDLDGDSNADMNVTLTGVSIGNLDNTDFNVH
jgi:hypothetical protein